MSVCGGSLSIPWSLSSALVDQVISSAWALHLLDHCTADAKQFAGFVTFFGNFRSTWGVIS
jgi:hypothetical protein